MLPERPSFATTASPAPTRSSRTGRRRLEVKERDVLPRVELVFRDQSILYTFVKLKK